MKRPSKTTDKILEDAYSKAEQGFKTTLSEKQKEWINNITQKVESQKAVITVLMTSLVKKIQTPTQDVRFHQEKMKLGYSGRTLDTQYITPFIKQKFRKFAMKESGWLTRSLEQASPYTLGYKGEIRDTQVKNSFLQVLNDIEKNKADAEAYLIYLLSELKKQMSHTQTLIKSVVVQTNETTIDAILEALKSHFFGKYKSYGASRLPVLALYSIYELMMNDVARYQNKKLSVLRSHTTPDEKEHIIGDIEIVDEKFQAFEGVEVKHNIAITSDLVDDAYQKFKEAPLNRYYLLTTAEPNIKVGEEQKVRGLIQKIKNEHGCEVIVNGIMSSLKYYLRLFKDPAKLLEKYTTNLKADFSETSDIKEEHILAWGRILKEMK